MKYRLAILTLIFALLNAISLVTQAQDEFGYEVYDSVEVDLRNGAIIDRYLPFDVPFKMVGNAKGLSSVKLSIIRADQQACCDLYSLHPTESSSDDCDNCGCQSITERRLAFYRNVRRINKEYNNLPKFYIKGINRSVKKFNRSISNYWSIDSLAKSVKNDDSIRTKTIDQLKATPTLLYNNRIFKTAEFIKYSKEYDSLLIEKVNLQDSLTKVEEDSIFYTMNKSKWTEYTNKHEEQIKKDSLRLCPICDFNPNSCNVIGEWKIDTIGSKKFHILIPPLEANRSYLFYFDITRPINDSERSRIKYVVSSSLLQVIDKELLQAFDIYQQGSLNIQEIRKLFVRENISQRHLEFIQKSITQYLDKTYSSTINSNSSHLAFDDSLAVKRLINEMIGHKYYKLHLDSLLKKYSRDTMLFCLKQSKLLNEDLYNNFYAANRMPDYYLLDTLRLLHNTTYTLISKDISTTTVPAGLAEYTNLYSVSLRRLQNVEDFNPATVNAYLTNLEKYSKYLQKVNLFVNTTLIQGSRDLRLRLLESPSYPSSPNIPEQIKKTRDAELIRDLHKFSKALYEHIKDVESSKRIYESFKSNLETINTQMNHLLDSALNDNQKIQLSTTRQTGSNVSANFKTRTDWLITADLGVAYLPLGDYSGQVVPYAGVNFNLAPINRQAHYALFRKGLTKIVDGDCRPNLWQRSQKLIAHVQKSSSIVVGITLTNPTSNISSLSPVLSIGNDSFGVMTGYGLRLTDAIRLGTGAVFLREDRNEFIPGDKVKPYWYGSVSIDIDVASALGAVGKILFPNRIGGGD